MLGGNVQFYLVCSIYFKIVKRQNGIFALQRDSRDPWEA